MLTIVSTTIISVAKLLVLVLFAFLANTALGVTIADNTGTFDKEILFKGVKKGVLILFSIFLLTVVLVGIYPVAEELQVDIFTPELTEVLSMASLIIPIFGGLVYYVTQSIKKITLLFGRKQSTEPTE